MAFNPDGSGPEGPRGFLPGSSGTWTWVAIALALLLLVVVGPTLGKGPDTDPIEDPAGENLDEIVTV